MAEEVYDEGTAEYRAQEIVDQFDELQAADPESDIVAHGGVNFRRVEYLTDGGVAIWLGLTVRPQRRIFNPPNLMLDPTGDILIGTRRFRLDPLGAIAQVILGTN